jgi:hypothetical protein
MDNQSLSQALREISINVLKGKKIDMLGMDACLMAMVEVGYIAHQYASVFIASQEVELANGWNYASFMQILSTKNTTPFLAAQAIVKSYETYYKSRVQFYTQSAINLELIGAIKDNLNAIITAYKTSQGHDKSTINSMVKKARKSCLQLSASNYIDLYTFYDDLYSQLSHSSSSSFQRSKATIDLKNALLNGMQLIEKAVIANTSGKNLSRAKGISIYFPNKNIDRSYPKTDFAKDCQWYSFLCELCG